MTGITPLSPAEAEREVGLTTTIPVEIIFAAGLRPLDLNNVFITSGSAPDLVEEAEHAGFPRNSCAWNKGIYAAVHRLGMKRIVAVVQGDCANTHALMEMLQSDGVEVVPFAFPYEPDDSQLLEISLDRFAAAFGVTREDGERWKTRLHEAREMAWRIDELCWKEGVISGEEQHVWTISCSDFFGAPNEYVKGAREVIADALARKPSDHALRLALVGIPPICDGLFQFLEEKGACVVFNEVPRQFAMPGRTSSLLEQYSKYTYPYDIFHRLADIKAQLKLRRVDAVIHYVQSFCFRHVQDAILRRELNLPILTVECDRPGALDMRTKTRVEAFIEMLHAHFPDLSKR